MFNPFKCTFALSAVAGTGYRLGMYRQLNRFGDKLTDVVLQ